jgi:heme exporter protein C
VPTPAPNQERDAVPLPLAIANAAALLISLYLIFIWAPMERSMGVVQRIFYFHLPSAFTAFVAFNVGGVASILYLSKRENRHDDLSVACNEAGLVFVIVNLVTGSLWAKPVWGVSWAWGDPRLETTLLLALIYTGYLILRQSVTEPSQRAVVCAVVSIFGMVDIPIIYMSNRWWRTQHPGPVLLGGEGSGLDTDMRVVLYFTFGAMLLLLWCLVRARRELERLQRQMESLRREVHSL